MNTTTKEVQSSEVKKYLSQILGQPVWKIWNAYGYVLYLEIGKILKTKMKAKSGDYIVEEGTWSLIADGYWKFWKNEKLFVDSREEDRAEIDVKIEKLKELTIQSFIFEEDLKSTTLTFQKDIVLTIENDKENDDIWSLVHHEKRSWLTATTGGMFKKQIYS